MAVVYRPPPSQKNRLSVTLFLDEFSSLLEKLVISNGPLLITGDFNFHLDNPSDRAAARFQVMLDVFDLKQHVRDSTHKNGHILDLVITRSRDQLVRNVRVSDPVISDHCAVRWKSPALKNQVSKRRLFAFENFVLLIEISLYRILGIHLSWITKTSVMSQHFLIAMTTLCVPYLINMHPSRNVLLRSDPLPLGIVITSNRRKQKGESWNDVGAAQS